MRYRQGLKEARRGLQCSALAALRQSMAFQHGRVRQQKRNVQSGLVPAGTKSPKHAVDWFGMDRIVSALLPVARETGG
jgi:hypothetical protein